MAIDSKRKLIFTTAVLTLLLFSAYATLIPNVNAAEITVQEKGLAISNDVISLDTTAYTVNVKEYPQGSYRDILPQEEVRYELSSANSNVNVHYTFVNGKLLMLDVLENHGSPRLTKTMNGVTEQAQDFLNNYQSYSGNSLYGELRELLVGVDSSRNSTKTNGNTKLEVSNYRERVTFRWVYSFNGIEAPDKVVALGYEKGFLEYFFDSWDLYKIGSTDLNVSEEEAIALGLARANNYSWPAGSNETFKVTNFNVTGAMIWETVFRSSLVADNARNEDLLMLYPMRHVWVSLDKFYPPGNVYGFNVYVWADTGEVCHIKERFSTVDPPPEMIASISNVTDTLEDTSDSALEVISSSLNFIAILPCVALVIGIAWVWLRRKKNFWMRRFLKLGGLLLCLLTLLLLAVPIATVNATSPKERAMIWGSESSLAKFSGGPTWSWRKHPDEVNRQNNTAAWLEEKFNAYDYVADDYQGDSGSQKTYILLQTSESDALYHHVAVIDFDHGNGAINIPISEVPSSEFHYMFEDQYGTISGGWEGSGVGPFSKLENAVFDFEVYRRTSEEKVFFALINTCNSANIDDKFAGYYNSKQGFVTGTERARGMPFSWSHRIVVDKDTPGFSTAQHMSDDGYADPDNGDFVYIGFNYGSAALDQTVQECSTSHDVWLRKFFVEALDGDKSVNEALDAACLCYFGRNFDQTPLGDEDGFQAIWPMYYADPPNYENPYWHDTTGDGWMKVYGNGNIHLKRKGGAWHFDETSGTTAVDSAHGHNGTLYNGAGHFYPKIGERSVSFDGNNDYMGVPSVSGLTGNTPHSIEAWVRVSSLPANRAWILQLGNAGTGSHHWLIKSTGATQFGVYNGGQTQPTLPVGKWTHIAMTFDGTTLKSYVNGALSQSVAATFNLQGTPLTLAKAYNGENYFNGAIDELRIYDYALSAGQIADHAAVASYHLNGGDYAYDSSPYGNTGTVAGISWSPGAHGYGLSFDGSVNDYVEADPFDFDFTEITAEFWMKTSDTTKTGTPISCSSGTQHNEFLIYNYKSFQIFIDGYGKPTYVSANDGGWHHIAVTWRKSDGSLKLYKDGVAVWSGTHRAGATINAANLILGQEQDSFGGGFDSSQAFKGRIDEVHIYDRVLSSTEIAANYNAMLPTILRELTVLAYDQYGAPLTEVGFFIDDEFIGTTPHTCYVTSGNHEIYVPYDLYILFFDYYYYNGQYYYDNEITIPVTSDNTIKVYYYSYYY